MRPRPAQRLRAPAALPPSGPEIASGLVPGAVIGAWRVTESIGARVHCAVDVTTGAAVVVKLAPAGELESEAAALRAVAHPNLVRLAGVHAGAIATTHVSGVTLAEQLARLGRLPWSTAAALLAPVADALAALHDAGWVHGDVSPGNIVVSDGSGTVLIDLGRAHRIGDPACPGGTAGSVAPEVAAGSPGGPAADVWSLAAVVVETVTGASLARGLTLPPGVALALRRALSDDLSARPSAAELAAALHAGAVHARGGSAPATPPHVVVDPGRGASGVSARVTRDYGPRPPSPELGVAVPPRRRWPFAVAVVAILAGAFVAFWSPGASRTGHGTAASCPPVPSGQLAGDPDGDGCPTVARWSRGVLTVVVEPGREPTRYALGATGDVVGLADWDCDGDDTPGLYRPSTGVITLYDTWPDAGPGAAPSVVTTGNALPDPGC